MIIKTDQEALKALQEALEALAALAQYLTGNNKETVKNPLTTQEICEAISKDFKRRRITHQIAADKIGAPRHTVTNQLSRKKRFGERLAKKFSEAFGYSITWLLYGEGDMFSKGNDAIKFKGRNNDI